MKTAKFWCGHSAPTPRKHIHPEPTNSPNMRYVEGGIVTVTWRDAAGIESAIELSFDALRDMLAFAEREEVALQQRREARLVAVGGGR